MVPEMYLQKATQSRTHHLIIVRDKVVIKWPLVKVSSEIGLCLHADLISPLYNNGNLCSIKVDTKVANESLSLPLELWQSHFIENPWNRLCSFLRSVKLSTIFIR